MKIVILGALGYVGFELCKPFKDSPNEIIAIDSSFLPDKVNYLVKNGIKFYYRFIRLPSNHLIFQRTIL